MTGGETVSALWHDAVERGGDREALVFVAGGGEGGPDRVERFSFRAIGARVSAIARGLEALGIGRGDRVALHLGNSPDHLALWLAVLELGAVAVQSSPRQAPDEARFLCSHAKVKAIAAAPADLARIAGALAAVKTLSLTIAVGGEFPGANPLDALAADGGGPVADRAQPGDDGAILYTSGTTSRPKGVRLPQAALALAARRMVENTALGEQDRHAVCAPMVHVNALTYSILPAIAAGASVLLMERFSRSRWLERVRAHRATVASLVTAMWRLLLEAPPSPAERDHALRLIGCATRNRALEERFGCATIGWYGMTETVGVPIVSPIGAGVFGRVGLARDGYALRVRVGEGDAEREAQAGEVGRLEVRGRIGLDLFAGYLDDDAATEAALAPDPEAAPEAGCAWLRTGDLVERDAGGWVRYVERAGDVIRRGGENVSAAEVERVLAEHPAVREAAAVGLDDPILGQRVAAAVILRPGAAATARALVAHCVERLADFKVPSEIRLVDELPRSTLDKVNRVALRRTW